MAQWIQEDIEAGKALSKAPLPKWVFQGPVAEAGGVHTEQGSFNPPRQFSPAACCRCTAPAVPRAAARRGRSALRDRGTTLHEDRNIRLWTLDHEVLIASLKTKMHTISPEVCEGLQQAVEMAEKEYRGMVVWSGDEPFSAGADLESTLPAFIAVGVAAIEDAEGFMQQTMLRLRYASVPVVSAIRGLALGGGCELGLYSARRWWRWKATSAWWKSAWAWFPAPAA